MFSSLAAGFLTLLALIVTIGAQNAFVLRQGIRRDTLGPVVALCIASDVTLILAGIAGLGRVLEAAPWLVPTMTWGGAGYLVWFGIRSLLSARRPDGLAASGTRARRPLLTAAAITWLNPHVYLDTVLLVGSVANAQGSPGRWWFALGACLGSTLWFTALGYGARALSRPLARPRVWQGIDVLVGLTMFAVAGLLLSQPL